MGRCIHVQHGSLPTDPALNETVLGRISDYRSVLPGQATGCPGGPVHGDLTVSVA